MRAHLTLRGTADAAPYLHTIWLYVNLIPVYSAHLLLNDTATSSLP
jgi:hypothetical protein